MENKNKDSVTETLPEIRNSYVDPDSGEKVKVTQDMALALHHHEHQIASATLTMAFGLKAIRDGKLYLLRGCETMKEYITTCVAKSYSSAKFYIQVADALDGLSQKQLEGLSIGALGDISRDLTLVGKLKKGEAQISGDKIVYADGNEESVEDFRAHLRAEIRKETQGEIKKATDAAAKARGEVKAFKTIVESKSQEILEREEEIANLRRTIDEVSQAKDIDPRRLRALNSKKEAMELMRTISEQVAEAMGSLHTIERDAFDAELAVHLKTCIASLETGLNKTKADFSDVLFISTQET